jgi:acyl transferase domain-containing protein
MSVANKLLVTSHAFHSDMMEPIVATFEQAVTKIKLNTPNIPIVSTVTGLKLTDEEAVTHNIQPPPQYCKICSMRQLRY